MLDDTLLDDPARLADADTAGALRASALAGAQVRAAVELADEMSLGARLDVGRPRALVLISRPGSGASVPRLLAALLSPGCPVPVVITDVVPSWIGALDVVFAHTDDPGDRELAGSLERAARFGATVVVSATPEGPVAASVAGKGVLITPRIPVPTGQVFARAYAVGLLTLRGLGLLDIDLESLADNLDSEAERDHLQHESFVNPAKALALRLADRTPLLWGLDPVATATAAQAAHVLAGHAALVSDVADYREAATRAALHRAAVAGTSGHDIFADPTDPDDPGGVRPRVLLLAVRSGPSVQAARMAAEDMFAAADILDISEEVEADEPTRAAVLALRFELASVYLGLAEGSIGGASRFTPYSA